MSEERGRDPAEFRRGSAYEKLIKALRLHDSTQIVAARGSACGTSECSAIALPVAR